MHALTKILSAAGAVAMLATPLAAVAAPHGFGGGWHGGGGGGWRGGGAGGWRGAGWRGAGWGGGWRGGGWRGAGWGGGGWQGARWGGYGWRGPGWGWGGGWGPGYYVAAGPVAYGDPGYAQPIAEQGPAVEQRTEQPVYQSRTYQRPIVRVHHRVLHHHHAIACVAAHR